MVTKGCIYYTDNRLLPFIFEKCQQELKKSWTGKIVSVSFLPIDLGENIVLEGYVRCYPTMVKQIVMALEALDTDIVFFTEHDVLYHPSHFNFTPPRDDIFYYNLNNWRWSVKEEVAITYDNLRSLSQLCCNRALALKHFQGRLKFITDKGYDKVVSREPKWARVMGYEPGTKPRRLGGFSDETFDIWKSEFPNVDIRHRHTFSPPKTSLTDFKHAPINWREESIDNIPYWNLRQLYNDWISKYTIR